MKKCILFILAVVLSTATKAQEYKYRYDHDLYPITYSLIIGGISALSVNSPDEVTTNKKTKLTGTFGLNVDFKLSDNFSIRPGIMFAGKGGVANGYYRDASNISADYSPIYNDYNLNYLEAPLNFLAHIPFNDNAAIYFGGGPFIGYGLNGKNTRSIGDTNQKQQVYLGANGDFNKADYGATAVLGFQANNGLSISTNADIGLKNILLTNNTGYNITGVKTLLFYISVGQSF